MPWNLEIEPHALLKPSWKSHAWRLNISPKFPRKNPGYKKIIGHLVTLPLKNEVRGGPGTLSRGDLHRNREEILQATHTMSAAGRQRLSNIVGDWGITEKGARFYDHDDQAGTR